MNYREYIQSDEWRSIAAARRRMDGNKCQECRAKHELDVHHKSYERLGLPGEINDLITLCRRCHADLHYEERFENLTEEEFAIHQPITEKDFLEARRVRIARECRKNGGENPKQAFMYRVQKHFDIKLQTEWRANEAKRERTKKKARIK